MKNKKHLTLKIILGLALTAGVERFCHHQTAGFQVSKVLSYFPFDERYVISSVTDPQIDQVNHLLSQRYHFLGHGGQGYSFISADGKYVLKLFKMHHMRVPDFIQKMSTVGRVKQLQESWMAYREKKHRKIFSSCKLAYDDLKEETGLLYVHLNTTKGLHPTVRIVDRIGVEIELHIDQAPFALQKKGELAFTTFKKDLLTHNQAGLKKEIASFLRFIADRSRKGIEDTDAGLYRNYAYLEEDLIQIDIGSFRRNNLLQEPSSMRKELLKKTQQLRKSLRAQDSNTCLFIEEMIDELVLSSS